MNKFELIRKLSKYLHENPLISYRRGSVPISVSSESEISKAIKSINSIFKDNFDESNLSVTDNSFLFATWNISHHNGSSFDRKEYEFVPSENLLDLILNDLTNQYEQVEFSKIERMEEEQRKQRIKRQIIPAEERMRFYEG